MTTTSLPKTLLTVADLANLLQVTPKAIYHLRDRGRLPAAIKFGHGIRWDPDDITAWLDQCKHTKD